MKKFAIFLPQFHEIEDNNKWWGKGYTEWTCVKNAKPLYGGHNQPKIPLNNNYYDLTDKNTVKWQTEIANEYGIDGFIYYHYYFTGKLIMEKPAENLLMWKDIPQKFFFCWANHTWVKGKGPDRKILIEQEYGDEKDWERHINYLMNFFKDERYEKKDNKPLLMIYNSNFKEKKSMIDFFETKCIEQGFKGIYIIETYTGSPQKKDVSSFVENTTDQTNMIYYREPNVATSVYYKRRPWLRLYHKFLREGNRKIFKNKVAKISGEKLYNIMKRYDISNTEDKLITRGLFFEWDNTPRHASRGYVISPPEYESFKEYIKLIKDDEYVFINAWNEWAEGMMLEPTESLKYKYLEWIKSVD